MKSHNYVISLVSAEDRRNHISSVFSEKNIPFEFFDAVIPNDTLITDILPNLNSANLTQGEKGCFLSHFLLWKKCVVEHLPYITIFEDDVLLGKNAKKFLSDYDWLVVRFNNSQENFIICLETFLAPVKLKKNKILSYQNRDFPLLKSTHIGAAGYIISCKTAKYLLEFVMDLSSDKLLPIDEIIFNDMLCLSDFNIYQISPAICIQELQLNKKRSKLTSQIELERKKLNRFNNEDKVKRSLWQKIFREMCRVVRRIKNIILKIFGLQTKIISFE